jgi:uncharacterized protein YutE (UPF0331/DUF86 family)
MVSVEKISLKFSKLDEYLILLKKISSTPTESFLKDKILIGSAKYYLQVSIECCLDVANHIIASEHFRAPSDYADSFKILEEQNLISKELSQKLRQMAKFRNRLVHLYGEIDDTYVYDFMSNDIIDIELFQRKIIEKFSRVNE